MDLTRRSFFRGTARAGLVAACAPMIVRAASIMPVRAPDDVGFLLHSENAFDTKAGVRLRGSLMGFQVGDRIEFSPDLWAPWGLTSRPYRVTAVTHTTISAA
jgi:hypothetical protein